jgi:hypothetical protein
MAGSHTDITERKRTEQALRAAVDEQRDLVARLRQSRSVCAP